MNVQFNDVFAFLISGPGITGTKNIALIPGTTIPVAINNLNSASQNTYFNDNGDGVFAGGSLVQYDGYTVKLKAVADVMPCNTYHLKWAIADVFDDLYDSGVFIEAGSISGTEKLLLGNLIAPDSLHICASEYPLPLIAGSNSIPNYSWTKDGVEVFTGNKIFNATSDGWYKVKAYGDQNCYWLDSLYIESDPDFAITVTPDIAICAGGAAALAVVPIGSSGHTYQWSPASGLSDPTSAVTVASPVATVSYTVDVTAGKCVQQESINVTVIGPFTLEATTPVEGCAGKAVTLHASGAEEYIWSPAANLDNATSADPTAILTDSEVFKVVGSNSCFRDSLEVEVTVFPFPSGKAYGDTVLCYGGTAVLNAAFGSYSYLWSPSVTVSDPAVYNPQVNPLITTDYTVSVSNHGCIVTDTVTVVVREEVKASILLPMHSVQVPGRIQLHNASSGADGYTWYFINADSVQVAEPDYELRTEGYYPVVLKAVNSLGCVDFDTLMLTAYSLYIPNLITPNEDEKNDSFQITGIGDQFALEVYNRWGDKVYQKSNYRNEWSGEGLTDGIYYFRVYDGYKGKEYKGWVQILR